MRDASDIHPGQLMMVGIPGRTLDAATHRLLRGHAVGGVILFARNVGDAEGTAALVRDLHAVSPERPILVAIDHEGGRVDRLGEPFTRFPPAVVVGRAGSPHLAYRQGVAMGEELRALGIDVDFAPVLDVHSNPRNPVIGDRSFGPRPRTVSRMAISLAHGLERAGVVACGKHFPGHGDTDVDSHFELPIVRKSLPELERTEFFPFRRAIQEGIDAVMSAHVLYPALDRSRPATLSRATLTDLLRDRLHFRGVVFSDDLEMKAISSRFGPVDAAVQSIEAGADGLLYCERLEAAIEVVEALQRLAERRARLKSRIAESAARVEQLRMRHLRRRRRDVEARAIPPEGFPKHRELVGWIVARAESRSAEDTA